MNKWSFVPTFVSTQLAKGRLGDKENMAKCYIIQMCNFALQERPEWVPHCHFNKCTIIFMIWANAQNYFATAIVFLHKQIRCQNMQYF